VVDFSWVRRTVGDAGWARSAPRSSRWPKRRGRLPSTTTPQLEVNLNTSGNFNDTNVNKKSLSLNVRTEGLETPSG
jgi:hypothetical protein